MQAWALPAEKIPNGFKHLQCPFATFCKDYRTARGIRKKLKTSETWAGSYSCVLNKVSRCRYRRGTASFCIQKNLYYVFIKQRPALQNFYSLQQGAQTSEEIICHLTASIVKAWISLLASETALKIETQTTKPAKLLTLSCGLCHSLPWPGFLLKCNAITPMALQRHPITYYGAYETLPQNWMSVINLHIRTGTGILSCDTR